MARFELTAIVALHTVARGDTHGCALLLPLVADCFHNCFYTWSEFQGYAVEIARRFPGDFTRASFETRRLIADYPDGRKLRGRPTWGVEASPPPVSIYPED